MLRGVRTAGDGRSFISGIAAAGLGVLSCSSVGRFMPSFAQTLSRFFDRRSPTHWPRQRAGIAAAAQNKLAFENSARSAMEAEVRFRTAEAISQWANRQTRRNAVTSCLPVTRSPSSVSAKWNRLPDTEFAEIPSVMCGRQSFAEFRLIFWNKLLLGVDLEPPQGTKAEHQRHRSKNTFGFEGALSTNVVAQVLRANKP